MQKKILIIDDSALMRRVISDIINTESELYVTETAENGEIAVDLLEKKNHYDLILVDINMPKMDGIRFLEFLNQKHYTVPSLVVSSIASRSTAETIRALELGAFDFVKKPDGVRGAISGEFKEQLLSKIQCVFDSNSNVNVREKTQKSVMRGKVREPQAVRNRVMRRGTGGKEIIFIASSTGGPKALQSVVPLFPDNIGCPVVIVQHMPEGFTASLAERLNEMSRCEVVEAEDGEVLKDGVIYVAKGGYQLGVYASGKNEHKFAVRKDAARNGLRPCADIFLESLMNTGYQKIYCAVLTGMGSDGTSGLIQLKEKKDVYIVGQSQETCIVYGMPRAVAQAGIVDTVADLQDVTEVLMKKAMS